MNGAPEESETPPDLPLEDLVIHSNWKFRVHAAEQMAKAFKQAGSDNDEEIFRRYSERFKKMAADANASALEACYDAIIAFLEFAPQSLCNEVAVVVTTGVVAKGLAGRPASKLRAINVVLAFVECESEAAEQSVLTLLEQGFTHKTPKIVSAAVTAVADAAEAFGPRALPVKQILAALPSCFDNRDKTVREEASRVCVIFEAWLSKAALQTCLDKLRPGQVKELETSIEAATAARNGQKPQATRKTRSAKAAEAAALASPASSAASGISEDAAGSAAVEDEADDLEFVEAVDVLAKLPKKWIEGLSAPKWSEKRDTIDALIELASAPKLAPGDFTEIVRGLKVLFADSNVVVVARSITALGKLASGLRGEFSSNARLVFAALIAKFTEKKTNVVDAIRATLVSFATLGALPLNECLEDIMATKEKKVVPKVRQEVAVWLKEVFEIAKGKASVRSSVAAVCSPIAEYLCLMLNESDVATRDAGAAALGALAGVVGKAPLDKFIDQLDPLKQKKVLSCFPDVLPTGNAIKAARLTTAAPSSAVAPSSSVQAVAASTSASSPAKANPKRAAQPKMSRSATQREVVPESSAVAAPAAAPAAAPKAALARRATTTAVAPATRPAATSGTRPACTAPSAEEPGDFLPSEDGLAIAREHIPEVIMNGLDSKNWKERVEAVQRLRAACGGEPATAAEGGDALPLDTLPSEVTAHVLFRLLAAKPGFKDSNVQVLSAAFETLAILISQMSRGGVNRAAAASVVLGAVEKMHDLKVKVAAGAMLTAMVSRYGLQFVATQLEKHSAKHKMPKVSGECLVWLSQTMREYGIGSVSDPVALVRWCKTVLENPNGATRSNAIEALATMRLFYGPSFRAYVDTGDVKPALLKLVDEAFAKVESEAPPAPTKAMAGESSASASAAPLELPRADVSGSIAPIIKLLGDGNWQTRRDGLEQVAQLLTKNSNRVKANIAPLVAALVQRLSDSNKNLISVALTTIGQVYTAMGAESESDRVSIGKVAVGAFASFGDKNAGVKSAATDCMTAVVAQTGMLPLATYLGATLEKLSGRLELLQWAEPHWTTFNNPLSDPSPKGVKARREAFDNMLKALIGCLEDKNAQVRHLAESALVDHVLASGVVPESALMQATQDLKPASKRAIEPIMDKMRASALNRKKPAQKPTRLEPKTEASAKPAVSSVASGSAPSPKRITAVQPMEKAPEKISTIALLTQGDPNGRMTQDQAVLERSRGWDFTDSSVLATVAQQLQSVCHQSLSQQLVFSCETTYKAGSPQDPTPAAIARVKNDVVKSGRYENELLMTYTIFFKWCALIVCRAGKNSALSVAALDLLGDVLEVLRSAKHRISDSDAATFIPALLRVDDSNLIQEVATAVHSASRVYPSSKIINLCQKDIDTSPLPLVALTVVHKFLLQHGLTVSNAPEVVDSIVHFIGRAGGESNATRQACGALHVVWNSAGSTKAERDSLFSVGGVLSNLMPQFHAQVRDWVDIKKGGEASGSRPADLGMSDAEVLAHSGVASQGQGTSLSAAERAAALAAMKRGLICPIYALQVVQSSQASDDSLRPVDEWAQALAHYMPIAVGILAEAAAAASESKSPDQQAVANAARPLRHILGTCNAILSREALQREFTLDGVQPLMAALFATAGEPTLSKAVQGCKIFNVGALESPLYQAVQGYLRGCSVCFDSLVKQHKPLAFVAMLSEFSIVIGRQGALKSKSWPPLVMVYCRVITREIRVLKSFVGHVDVIGVLGACHEFWRKFPPDVWQQRASQNDSANSDKTTAGDYPHRLVKTALNELISALGPSAAAEYERKLPEGIVGDYYRLLLQAQKNKDPTREDAVKKELSSVQKQELTDLAAELGQMTGLQKLRAWQAANPSVDVWAQQPLKDFSSQWREHVKRSLQALGAADKENSDVATAVAAVRGTSSESADLVSNVEDTMSRITSLRDRMASMGVDVANLPIKAEEPAVPTATTITSDNIQRYRERLTKIREALATAQQD